MPHLPLLRVGLAFDFALGVSAGFWVPHILFRDVGSCARLAITDRKNLGVIPNRSAHFAEREESLAFDFASEASADLKS